MIQRREDKGKSGIYMITCMVTNKSYIGKAKCIYLRIKQHVTLLNKKSKDENRYLINAWHKYGRSAFIYKVLEYLPLDEEKLSEREEFWINDMKTLNRNKGFNLRMDTSTKLIVHHDTILRLSASQKQRFTDPLERQKCSSYRRWTDDKKRKMSENVSKAKIRYNIAQYDENVIFVKEWTQMELKKSKYNLLHVLKMCNGTQKGFLYGCIWRYKCIASGEIIYQEIPIKKDYTILKICKKTNRVIKEYACSFEANKENPHGKDNIASMCKNNKFFKKVDYFFRYKNTWNGQE